MELQNMKLVKQDLEFKVKNYEDNNNILNDSDIYEDSFDVIEKELNTDDLIEKIEELKRE